MALRNIPRAPIIAFALFLLMAVPSFTEFYTDWLWFGEVGYRALFMKSITTRSGLGGDVVVYVGALIP